MAVLKCLLTEVAESYKTRLFKNSSSICCTCELNPPLLKEATERSGTVGFVRPLHTLHGNQTYLLAGLFAYNLVRELQMQTTKPLRRTTAKRASLWIFEKVDTLRKTLIQRAGRLTRPKGTLTLTISANHCIKRRLLNTLDTIPASV